MIKSITRHREFTGPTPHSVAIVSTLSVIILEKNNSKQKKKSIKDQRNTSFEGFA